MVKDLAHSLLADDERLVADAMPHEAAAASASASGSVGLTGTTRPLICGGESGPGERGRE